LPERIKEKRDKELNYIYSIYLKGKSQKLEGNIEDAITLFEKGLEEIYKVSAFYDYLEINGSKIYLKAELEDMLLLSKQQKEEAINLYENIKVLLKENKLIKARDNFDEAVKKFKNFKEREKIEAKLENLEGEFKKELEKGKHFLNMNEYSKAIDSFRKAINLNQDSEEAKLFLKEAERKYKEEKAFSAHNLRFSFLTGSFSLENKTVQQKDKFETYGISLGITLNAKAFRKSSVINEIFVEYKKAKISGVNYPEIIDKSIGISFCPALSSKGTMNFYFDVIALYSEYMEQIDSQKTSFFNLGLGIGLSYNLKILEFKLSYRIYTLLNNDDTSYNYDFSTHKEAIESLDIKL